jgi:hypothetical protein
VICPIPSPSSSNGGASVNPAYKHLTDRLRIGELTVPQIVGLFCGVMAGLLFALYVSPFSPYLTLCLAIYIACVPAGVVLLASSTEFDAWLYLRTRLGESMVDGRYEPGPGFTFTGYSIQVDRTSPGRARELQQPDMGALWDL